MITREAVATKRMSLTPSPWSHHSKTRVEISRQAAPNHHDATWLLTAQTLRTLLLCGVLVIWWCLGRVSACTILITVNTVVFLDRTLLIDFGQLNTIIVCCIQHSRLACIARTLLRQQRTSQPPATRGSSFLWSVKGWLE
jgi:hypothetical protein